MSGFVLTGHGGPEKLEWREDLVVPEPGPHDVLIKVGAAGINNTDINTRTAWYSRQDGLEADATWAGHRLDFPRIQGADVCGRIVAIGEQVSPKRLGERVLIEPCLKHANGQQLETPWYLGSECDGGFAEFTCVDTRHAFAVDSQYSDIELASFPCSYSTAENILTRVGVTQEDRVLITGASGGVGSAAIQLARARGAEIVCISSLSKAQKLRQLGASDVVDRNDDPKTAFGENSFDVVVDLVAGPNWPSLLDILRPGGKYAVAGAIAGPHVELDVRTLYLKDLSFFGCTVLDDGVFSNLVHRIESGFVRPIVSDCYSLEELKTAQKDFLEKRHVGKLVVRVDACTGSA